MATSEIVKCDNCGSLNSFDPDITTKCVSCGASLAEEIERDREVEKRQSIKKTVSIRFPSRITCERVGKSIKLIFDFPGSDPSQEKVSFKREELSGNRWEDYIIRKVYGEVDVILSTKILHVLLDTPFNQGYEPYYPPGYTTIDSIWKNR